MSHYILIHPDGTETRCETFQESSARYRSGDRLDLHYHGRIIRVPINEQPKPKEPKGA